MQVKEPTTVWKVLPRQQYVDIALTSWLNSNWIAQLCRCRLTSGKAPRFLIFLRKKDGDSEVDRNESCVCFLGEKKRLTEMNVLFCFVFCFLGEK